MAEFCSREAEIYSQEAEICSQEAIYSHYLATPSRLGRRGESLEGPGGRRMYEVREDEEEAERHVWRH